MIVSTWNVNSIKVRLPNVLQYLAEYEPDILVWQETKSIDLNFPKDEIQSCGYNSYYCGQKTYNGVTTISKKPPTESIKKINQKEQDQKRFLLTRYGKDLSVLNLYVVNGQEVGAEKYDYKLAWLKDVTKHLKKDLAKNMIKITEQEYLIELLKIKKRILIHPEKV